VDIPQPIKYYEHDITGRIHLGTHMHMLENEKFTKILLEERRNIHSCYNL
jgi:hypothetical protein